MVSQSVASGIKGVVVGMQATTAPTNKKNPLKSRGFGQKMMWRISDSNR